MGKRNDEIAAIFEDQRRYNAMNERERDAYELGQMRDRRQQPDGHDGNL